jgi:hypothetical protein
MTSHIVIIPKISKQWLVEFAFFKSAIAPRVKSAAGRRILWRRYIPR